MEKTVRELMVDSHPNWGAAELAIFRTKDYAEPLIELREWERKYAEAMRNKKPAQAHEAAMKMVRLAVDLLEIAEWR